VRLRAGYQQLYVLLRREGWRVNHKRIYRLYTEEGLALRRRRPRRHRSAVVRVRPAPPSGPNEQWAMDFMQDTLADGRAVRILTVIDIYTRECLAAVSAGAFRGDDVVRVLSHLAARRSRPQRIRVDNGTEFTSKALDHWTYFNGVELVCLPFIRPDAHHAARRTYSWCSPPTRGTATTPPSLGSAAAQGGAGVCLCSEINVSGSRCSSRRTSTGFPADAARRSPRHGQGIPVESSQSPLPHRRFATASVAR
jgi:hypothetical protein